MATAKTEEDETSDLRISDLLRWQEVLRVPLQDLLVEPETALSAPVRERAQMLRLMKTAASLKATVKNKRAEHFAAQMVQQLIEMMPELKNVLAWHSVGQRRSPEEYGRAVERMQSDDLFHARY